MADTGFNVFEGLCNLRAVLEDSCVHFPITFTPPVYTGASASGDVYSGRPTPSTAKTGFAYQYANNEGGMNSLTVKVNYDTIDEASLKDGCNNIFYFRAEQKVPKSADITLSMGNISREVLSTISDGRVLVEATVNTGTEFMQSGNFPFWWIETDRRYHPTGVAPCTSPYNRVVLYEVQLVPPEELFNLSKDVPEGYEFTGTANYVKIPVAGYTGPYADIPAVLSVGYSGKKRIGFERNVSAVQTAVSAVGMVNV
jgi:hypothetical protein